MADILAEVLGDALEHGGAEDFLQAFRRATLGKEGQGVLRDLEKFLGHWHGWWKAGIGLDGWGGGDVFGALPEVEAWERDKRALLGVLRQQDQGDAVVKLLDLFEGHTVGSGRIAKAGALFDRLLEALPGEGVKKVALVAPGFSADCLETLEEIAVENRLVFQRAGGGEFRYIPCLNDSDAHIDMMVALVAEHLPQSKILSSMRADNA